MPSERHEPTALETLVRDGSDADLRRFVRLLRPPDIADMIEALASSEDRARAFRAIAGRERSEVLREVREGDRSAVIEELEAEETARLLEGMKSDDAADLLQELDEEQQDEIIEKLEPRDRDEIRQMLAYPEESAGGIMQTELVRVREEWTAREAIEEIRRLGEEIGELHEVFVVGPHGRLRGWVRERALILAEDATPIRDITSRVPVVVNVSMDQEEVGRLVRDYDLSSVPVVDTEERLLGRVLVDDVLDVIMEEATEDITRMGGTDAEEIYEPSVWNALKARSPWLLVTFIGGILAAQIMESGDDLIKAAGALFAYVPVIMGMGGGCSTQATTVTVRSLGLGRINLRQVGTVIRKELLVGLALALAAGLLLYAVAWLSQRDTAVAIIAACAIFGTMCLGALFGVLTPLILNKWGADPAVAASPFVTTANDVLGSTLIVWITLIVTS